MLNYTDDFFKSLKKAGGYYQCPKDEKGNFLGPLVGYAGTYDDNGQKKSYVGEIYANLAKIDENPLLLQTCANQLLFRCNNATLPRIFPKIDAFCAAPIGGYSFATALGLRICRDDPDWRVKVIKAEKRITSFATQDSREKSELIFGRHSVLKGNRYVIVEDVCNNFSTTKDLMKLIKSYGGEVLAIFCLLNRSLEYDDIYYPDKINSSELSGLFPVSIFSVARKKIQEYRQDDPHVAQEIEKGNVIWKPKDHWPQLMRAMDENKK